MTPFFDQEPMKMYEKIVKEEFCFPNDLSKTAKSLISHLLKKDLTKRYGNLQNASFDIKIHPFYDMIDWNALYRKEIKAPYVPDLESPGDTSYFDYFEKP